MWAAQGGVMTSRCDPQLGSWESLDTRELELVYLDIIYRVADYEAKV